MTIFDKGQNRRQSDGPTDWISIVGILVPAIFVACGWMFGTLRPDDTSRILLITYASTAIFGFSLSNLIKNHELIRKMDKYMEVDLEYKSENSKKIDKVISDSRVLSSVLDDADLISVEQYARWLSANRALANEVSAVSAFCAWQRAQIQNMLSMKARECRDRELVVDDAVKELTSNTDLLLAVPEREVIAISFEDTPFWKSDEGAKFLEAHKEVIARGVHVTRIFVVKGAEEIDLKSIMDEQTKLGIEVYIVDYNSVQHLSPGDAVLYDKTILRKGYNSIETQNNMFKRARIIATKGVIEAEFERCQALKSMAKRWAGDL